MSSGGQALGGVVGAVAGFFLGGPTGALYGAQIGMLAGGYLDPPKGPTLEGPRLSDLSVQSSTYGAVIPRVYGTVTVNGNVFWLENNTIKETVTKKKSGGKGGGSKSTTRNYNYSATFAVGLCKGPIAGVKRIWIGADLYYDAGSSDPGTIQASNDAAAGFDVYNGTDTQAADARMQATLGVANTPAWRGLAYIVFSDLPLTKYGNSLAGAQVRVEVMTLGATYSYSFTDQSMPNSRAWTATAWNGSVFCTVAASTNICATSTDGITWTEHTLPVSQAWQDIEYGAGLFVLAGNGANAYTSPDGITWTARAWATSAYHTQVVWNGSQFLAIVDSFDFETSPDGITWTAQTKPAGGSYGKSLAWNGSVWVTVKHFADNAILSSPSGASGSWTSRQVPVGSNWDAIAVLGTRFCLTSTGYVGTYTSDDGITWSYNTGLPANINSITSDGRVFIATDQGNYYTSSDGIAWTTHTVTYAGITWTGLCYNGGVISGVGGSSARAIVITPYFASSLVPTLENVVMAECLQSGLLSAGDIDATALTQDVRGYRVGSVGAIRSALEPLQAAWPFDVRQHGYKIQCVARGGSSVVTIPAADLDARSGGNSPGVQITTSREMDSQIARRVTVQHLDYDR
jgi:hypothetical protein